MNISILTALIMKNYEWLFGGLGVAVIGWIFFRNNSQIQKGGDNSTNLQVGKNFNINNSFNETKNRK